MRDNGAISSECRIFFEDYSRSDASLDNTLPVFLRASSGDTSAMREIFSDYARFGSGDNEAWGDVPDVILREVGDKTYAEFVANSDSNVRSSSLRWLGLPGSTLFEDIGLSRSFPRTSQLQQHEFRLLDANEAKKKKHNNKPEMAMPRKPSD